MHLAISFLLCAIRIRATIKLAHAINIDIERIEIASAFQTSAAHRADREAVSAHRADTMREPLSPRFPSKTK